MPVLNGQVGSNTMKAPFLLHTLVPGVGFPPVCQALDDPNGLLAIGGDLSPERLLEAYRQGIFPWYSEGQSILWWSPDPRLVLFPSELKVSRSLRKVINKGLFRITMDRAFPEVIRACAEPREYEDGTWITPDMEAAYLHLHRLGWAHSVEAWHGGELVGGFYGVAIGRVFFGESMFHRMSDASKVAFVTFVRELPARGYELVDCQVTTAHLLGFGAREISRSEFVRLLGRWCGETDESGEEWPADFR